MPDKQDPKHGDPHPDGDGTFWSRAARLFVVPAEEVAHENGTVAQPSAANKPAAADVSTTVVAPAIPGGVAIDQGKYDNAVAAVTKKYPGLVILNQAWQESEGEGFSEQQRVRLALKRLSSNGIGVMPLLDQFTHAVSDVEQQEQLVLKESEELLDSKVGNSSQTAILTISTP